MTGQIWHSYDFSAHVFFATHYQRSWWSLWEPRWFDGFNVASYPPLPHQLAALIGWLIGNGHAVSLLTTGAVIVFPVAVSELARRYFGSRAARRCAALAVVTPSVLLAAYAFGQLPTLFALDTSLFAAAALSAYLVRGGIRRLALALALGGTTVAAHHATFIFFLPPLLGMIVLAELVRTRQPRRIISHALYAVVGLGLTALVVVFPFWVWHATEYVAQVAIDHQTRHNYFHDVIAQDLFFWGEHGVLAATPIITVPLLWSRFMRTIPWYMFGVFLLILGLGGTTTLPSLLFGSQWAWLTFDRFSLWADVPLVILLGVFASWLLDKRRNRTPVARSAWSITLALLGIYATASAFSPALVQTQPAPVDPRPVVAFLQQDDRARWRYLTFGLGEQAGILESLTDAGSVDGYYYTARRLPLLTQSGIADLDFSLLWDASASTVKQLLQNPRAESLRWAFTGASSYEKLLVDAGWQYRARLSNGLDVWEAGVDVPPVGPLPDRSGVVAIWWGVVPLAVFASVGPAVWWARRGRRNVVAWDKPRKNLANVQATSSAGACPSPVAGPLGDAAPGLRRDEHERGTIPRATDPFLDR